MRLAFLALGPVILTACATTSALPPDFASDLASEPATASSRAAPADATAAVPTASRSFLHADATLPPQGPPPGMVAAPRPAPASSWRKGEAALQGYIGAAFETLDTEGGSIANLEDDDISFPTIGGGAQWKLAGDEIDFGAEGLLSFAWRGNVAAFAVGGGGAAVAVDIDTLIFDFYGGPFVGAFLGDKTRVYVGAGPLMRWCLYDQDGPTGFTSGHGDGFGFGYYARAGIEFALSRGSMIGVCARWTDVEVDLNGPLGDLEAHGVEALLTISQGF